MAINYNEWIGKKVEKRGKIKSDRQTKPFKSGKLINTVKGVINHPQLNIPALTFEEDDSYVEAKVCRLL